MLKLFILFEDKCHLQPVALHATLQENCERHVGSTCTLDCGQGFNYKLLNSESNATAQGVAVCHASGKWNVEDFFCESELLDIFSKYAYVVLKY